MPASPEASVNCVIVLSYRIFFIGIDGKTSPSCWVLPFLFSIKWLYQSSKYHSINFSPVFSSLLQVKLRCLSVVCLFFFFFNVSLCNRGLQEHLCHWCPLVPFWHPEMWPAVWLLDIWRLVSGLTGAGDRHHRLHRQRRVGSCWWEGLVVFNLWMIDSQKYISDFVPLFLSVKSELLHNFWPHFCYTGLCFTASHRGCWTKERTCLQVLLWAVSWSHLHRGNAKTDPLLWP